jgi:hypothetical protein
MTDLFTWGNVITAIAALVAFGMGAIVVPRRPWYREAQVAFLGVAIVAYVKIMLWGFTSHHDVGWRVGWSVFGLLAVSGFAGALIWRVQGHIREDRQRPSPPETVSRECPDKWLHDIALAHRQNISRFVHVEECAIQRHELLRENPYIDFAIVVTNQSVYDITMDTLGGHLDFGRNLLAKPVEWASNPVVNRPLGSIDTIIVRQPLEKEEVIYILNGKGECFDFGDLEISISGGAEFPEVKAENLYLQDKSAGSEDLLEAYPKIPINIRTAKSEMIANLQTWGIVNDTIINSDGLINLELHLKINRSVPARIVSAHLSANLRGSIRPLRAGVGDIWEGEVVHENGQVGTKGKKLPNLMSSEPLIVDETGVSGFVQFRIDRAGPGILDQIDFALTLKDQSGEEHWLNGTIPAHRF